MGKSGETYFSKDGKKSITIADSKKKSSDDSKGAGILITIGIGIFLLILVFSFFYNFLRLSTIANYGIGQYVKNIVHCHHNSYKVILKPYILFDEVKLISEAEQGKGSICNLKANQNVEFRGYKRTDSTTWIAVYLFKDDKEIYGYIYIPKKIDYDIMEIDNQTNYWASADRNKILELQRNKYKNELYKTIPITTLTSSLQIEKLKESSDFSEKFIELNEKYIFWGPKDSFTYVTKELFDKIDQLYDKYLDDDIVEKTFLKYI